MRPSALLTIRDWDWIDLVEYERRLGFIWSTQIGLGAGLRKLARRSWVAVECWSFETNLTLNCDSSSHLDLAVAVKVFWPCNGISMTRLYVLSMLGLAWLGKYCIFILNNRVSYGLPRGTNLTYEIVGWLDKWVLL